MATESVILTLVIDVRERRETMVIDVPNAFIQNVVEDKKKRVIICILDMLVGQEHARSIQGLCNNQQEG